MSEGMDLSNVIFGSKGLNVREIIFDNLKDSEFDKGISNDLDFENLVKITEKLSQHSLDIVKHIKNFSFDSIGILEKILDHDKKSVKLRTEDDVRRDKLIKKISVINEKTFELTEDIKKEEKKLKREKSDLLKEIPDSSDSSVARETITGNSFTKSIKLKMFDLQKGFSDSLKDIPIFGESDFIKKLSEKFNPEDSNQLKVEKFKELDRNIERKKELSSIATGDKKIILEKQISEMESEKESISIELGDSIKDLNKTEDKLSSLEFDKLLHETNSQNEILEEIKTLLSEDIGDELKLELQEKASLIEKEKNNKIDQLIKLQDQQSQTLSQEKSAELQEKEVERAEERTWMQSLFESLTGEESDSDKSGKEKKKGGLFGGIMGLFGKDGKTSKLKGFFGEGGGFEKKMTVIKGLSASISTFFATLASSLSAFITPLLPVIGIVAGIALVAYSIYEAFDEMFEVFDSTGSIVETLKAGLSRFVGTMFGLPLDLLKGAISYVADWLGFEDFSKWLDSFSFADIITEFYVKFLDYIELAILGVNDFIKDLFGVDILGALGEFLNLFNWDVIMADLKSYWESFKSKFSNIGEDLTSWFSESWQSFKTTFSELWGGLSSWISEKWEGLKITLGEKWEEIEEKFGLGPIITSIVDKVKSIFTMVIDKISSIGSSVLSFLSPIGIPKMELIGESSWFKGLSVGPWYPFKDGGGEGAPQAPEAEPKPEKTPGKLLKEAEKNGGSFDFLSKINPFSWGSSDASEDPKQIEIDMMKESIEKEISRGNLTQANYFLRSMADVLPPKEFENIRSKILEANKNKKLQTSTNQISNTSDSLQKSIINSVQHTSTNQISNSLDSAQTDSNNIKLEKENNKSVEKSSGDSFSSVNQNNSRKYVSTNNYAYKGKIFSAP